MFPHKHTRYYGNTIIHQQMLHAQALTQSLNMSNVEPWYYTWTNDKRMNNDNKSQHVGNTHQEMQSIIRLFKLHNNAGKPTFSQTGKRSDTAVVGLSFWRTKW